MRLTLGTAEIDVEVDTAPAREPTVLVIKRLGPRPASVTVDWGDGDLSMLDLSSGSVEHSHWYATEGEKRIIISGPDGKASFTVTIGSVQEMDIVEFIEAALIGLDELVAKRTSQPNVLELVGGTFEQEGVITTIERKRRLIFRPVITQNVGRTRITVHFGTRPLEVVEAER